ncbi:hypothetical protein AAHC03_04372 [Spirometra sp. Aus1]|nr:unnamed protein product [Spirometra erinaceieuropaei]
MSRFQLLKKFVPFLASFTRQASAPAKPWKAMRLNHVAIAVPNLEKASAFYRDVIGAKVSAPEPQPEHGVYTVFVQLDNTKLELLSPLGEKSPIKGFLEKNKAGGIHHICLDVSDIKAAIKDLGAKNVRTLGNEPKTGAHGYPVIFLHPKDASGVLTELEEPDEAWKKAHQKK